MAKFDHNGTIQDTNYRLYMHPIFQHLIQQYKYGISQRKYMSWNNMFIIAQCLIDIGYIDYEIIGILIDTIQKKLNKQDQNKCIVQPRLYQMEKQGYYNINQKQTHQQLMNNQQLSSVLSIIRNKIEFYEQQQLFDQKIKKISDKNQYEMIKQLVNEIRNLKRNLIKFIESLITIRKQWLKMIKISKKQDLLRTPELNYQLLEVQEMLIECKILSIKDLKNPQQIYNKQYQILRISNIITEFIESNELLELQKYTMFKQTNTKSNVNQLQSSELSYGLLVLAKLASEKRVLYGTTDGINLINVKWEKTLVGLRELHQHLPISNIFRRVWKDVYQLQLRNFSILEFMFVDIELKYIIQWIDSLCLMGLHEDCINLLKKYNFSYENLSSYSLKQLQSLISILNHIGGKIVINQLKNSLLIQIQNITNLYYKHQVILSIKFICNIIDYLYQYENIRYANQKIKNIYQYYIQQLYKEVQAYQGCSLNALKQNEELKIAYRILIFQMDQKQYKKNITMKILINQQLENKKQTIETTDTEFQFNSNPFFEIIANLCQKYTKQKCPLNEYQIFQTGFNNFGTQTGIYLASSQESSIDGKHLSGHTIAYLLRIKQFLHLSLIDLSINSFLEINYRQESIRMKNRKEIQKLLHCFWRKQNSIIFTFIGKLIKAIENIMHLISRQAKMCFNLIFVTLKNIMKMQKQCQTSLSFNYYISKRWQLFISIDEIKRNLKLLSNSNNKLLCEVYQKQNKQDLINSIEQLQQKLIQNIKLPENNTALNLFEGHRLTIQQLKYQKQKVFSNQNLAYQLLNYTSYINKSYVEYKDWQKLLLEQTNYQQIRYKDGNYLNKILASYFLPKMNEVIHSLPINDNKQQYSDNLKKIITIQNYIHQLKMTKNVQQLCDYILNFQFISQLIAPSIQNINKVQIIPRNAKDYFNYLEYCIDKMFLQSPYLNYIQEKVQRNQEIKQLYQKLRNNKIKLRIKMQNGLINHKQYNKAVQQVQKQIIEKMKEFSFKVLDSIDDSYIAQRGLKMIQLEQNYEDYCRQFERVKLYQQQLDYNYINCQGDYNKMLQIRRNQVQNNFIIFSLLYKIGRNVTLNQLEINYIHSWITETNKSIQDPLRKDIHCPFTKMTIKDLSIQDQKHLELKATNLTNHPDLAVSDLLLELHNLLDENVLLNIKNNVKALHYSKQYAIPIDFFKSSVNKYFTQMCFKKQQKIMNQSAKLNFQDVKLLIEMIGTLKVQGYNSRQRYNEHYSKIKQDLFLFNQNPHRIEYISEYIRCKENQFHQKYNPQAIQHLKEQQINFMWKEVFGTDTKLNYTNFNKQCMKLCTRIQYMQNKCPPYFGLFLIRILLHQHCSILIKQTLIANLQKYKIDIQIDSNNLKQLFQLKLNKNDSNNNCDQIIMQNGGQILINNLSMRMMQL